MGLQTVPGYISQAGYTHPAELLRNFHKAVAGARSGIMRYGQLEVSGTGVSNQIQITPGGAVLVGAESAAQGAYFCWLDANELVSVPAAPGSNARIDTLLLRVADPQYGTITGLPRAYWDVQSSAVAASPTVLPDSTFNVGGSSYQPGAWFRVADLRRNAGDTTVVGARIYPSRVYARTGGRTVGNSTASTTGFGGFPTDPQPGDLHYAVDLGIEFRYTGTAWLPRSSYIVGEKTQTASITTTGAEAFSSEGWITANLYAGGKYRFTYSGGYYGVAGEKCVTRLRYLAGSSLTASGTLLQAARRSQDNYSTGGILNASITGTFTAPSSAQYTVGISIERTLGSGTEGLFSNNGTDAYGYSCLEYVGLP